MHIHPIKSDADHEEALREIEALWGAEEGSEAGNRLDILVTLTEDYERRRWPIEPLDPVRAIEAAMEMNGYTRAQLAKLIGQSRATEILARQRALTLPMIRKIAGAWHVPEKVLVQEYALAKG
jgi:HTH-type transcriptional regulator/antitoxin HigA